MNEEGLPEDGPQEFTRAQPDRPVLVTGLASAALMDGSAEFSQLRETRGAAIEWGGVYGQGVRLTGPWRLQVRTARATYPLAGTLERLRVFRWGVESQHRTPEFRILQQVVPLPARPGIGRRLSFETVDGAEPDLTVAVAFEPFLAPVIVEGIKPYSYLVEAEPHHPLRVFSHGFGMVVESDRGADALRVNGEPWSGGSQSGEVRSIETEYSLSLRADGARALSLATWGGLESTVKDALSRRVAAVTDRTGWVAAAQEAWTQWLGQTPRLRFPSAPKLETAYREARGALRMLYTQPDTEITGLVAGYPWYSALWCRDLAWMLPAVLWMGDVDWVERSLRSVFRFQARSNIPILGAEAGELPMQISPGPIFLYGTSDTTLHYPSLVRRLVDSTGSTDFAAEQFPVLQRIDEWANHKRDPDSGLLTNGGEVAALRAATSGLGKIHVGFDALDTTIWDSTDRRDHAVDVQVLLIAALTDLAELGEKLGHSPIARNSRVAAEELTNTVIRSYAWPEESYWFDSLHRDLTPVRKVRPNALRAVAAGLLPPEAGRAAVQRAAREDLSTVWGVRTLSSLDPTFDPIAYHDGQVWTIATAWAAEAALRVGEADRGAAYLDIIAERIARESGLANECYRGDRDAPYNSCYLLGFSVAPFLSVLFDALWGLRPRMLERTVELAPCFPSSWKEASIEGLKLAEGTLDLGWRSGRITALWKGRDPISIRARTTLVKLAPGRGVEFDLPSAEQTI